MKIINTAHRKLPVMLSTWHHRYKVRGILLEARLLQSDAPAVLALLALKGLDAIAQGETLGIGIRSYTP